MRIETINFVQKHASNLPLEEPIIVTQNGEPAYVIENYAQRKLRDDAIAMLKLASFSEKDVESQRVTTSESLACRLKSRLKGR